MSADWEIGFSKKPRLEELDDFMTSKGFTIEPQERPSSYIRIYQHNNPGPKNWREVLFFYEDKRDKIHKRIPDSEKELAIVVASLGQLVAPSVAPTYPNPKEREKIVREKKVDTERKYYEHLDPERHVWYETALALRDNFNAVVISAQTSEEIDPDKPFPEK